MTTAHRSLSTLPEDRRQPQDPCDVEPTPTYAVPEAVAAAQEPFLSLVKDLVRAYQAFTAYSDTHVRQLGLTPPQFDVIVTLGNTAGMTMNVLADKTLVTKGTLTGIVDRLEQKGLVQRQVPPENRRCFKIVLTPAGEALFAQIFPAHIAHLKQRLGQLTPDQVRQIRQSLSLVRELF